MISQTVEYALRAIVALANQYDEPCTSQRLAEKTCVPGPYLSKVMQSLVRGGVVKSQRGLRGGFRLSSPPSEMTIWDVVDAVEPIQRIKECPLGIGSHAGTLCPLHRRLDDAMAWVETSFRETTVDELLHEDPSVTPLCETQSFVQLAGGSGQPKKKP